MKLKNQKHDKIRHTEMLKYTYRNIKNIHTEMIKHTYRNDKTYI